MDTEYKFNWSLVHIAVSEIIAAMLSAFHILYYLRPCCHTSISICFSLLPPKISLNFCARNAFLSISPFFSTSSSSPFLSLFSFFFSLFLLFLLLPYSLSISLSFILSTSFLFIYFSHLLSHSLPPVTSLWTARPYYSPHRYPL